MDDLIRQALNLPDALSFLEEAERAPDPLFGVMHMLDAMPSPNTLIQMSQGFQGEASPEPSEQTRSPAAADFEGITASPESITLRETEPVAIPVTEFEGVDLVDQHPDTIDHLMAQPDHFLEDMEMPREAATPEEREREMERAEGAADLEREGVRDPTASTVELQPTTTLSDEEAMLLPQEESAERRRPPTDQTTPVSVPPPPSPPPAVRPALEEVPPAEERQRRRGRGRRQLIFFDPETQIPQEELQQQINTPGLETRAPSHPPPSSLRMTPAAELFNMPCTPLPPEVLLLWRRAATVRSVSGSDLQVGERGPESTDTEREGQPETVEAAETEQERLGLSPREVPRDAAESEMFDISAHGSLPLEISDQREMSREISPLYTSEREGSPVSRSVSALQDIPEVPDEVHQRATAESPGLLPELTRATPVLFQSLLPPDSDRRAVSNIFQRLLEMLSANMLRVEQNEPYGDIWILSGPGFEEALLTGIQTRSPQSP
ncbi:meiotic recombination protein REC8 homolog [Xyrichtys novacula]|nr:meiotic recombination protein REC8 homolog [Xyrichtys novacula]